MNIQPRLAMRDIDSTPEGMEDDLKAYFAENVDVKKAYIDGVKANNTDGFVVVLELENENNVREIADHVAKAINKYGSCVVAPISSPIGKKVLERKTAFYEA